MGAVRVRICAGFCGGGHVSLIDWCIRGSRSDEILVIGPRGIADGGRRPLPCPTTLSRVKATPARASRYGDEINQRVSGVVGRQRPKESSGLALAAVDERPSKPMNGHPPGTAGLLAKRDTSGSPLEMPKQGRIHRERVLLEAFSQVGTGDRTVTRTAAGRLLLCWRHAP